MTVLRFVGFEVHGVKEHGEHAEVCVDAQADFFSIYGVLLNAHGSPEYCCIGDFSTRDAAELVVELIGS